MTASATGSFWEECRRARPDLAAVEPRVRRFGNTPDVCRNLLNLIVAGEKTATFSLLWEHEASGEPLPRRGDVYIVTDYEGAPGCARGATRVPTCSAKLQGHAWRSRAMAASARSSRLRPWLRWRRTSSS